MRGNVLKAIKILDADYGPLRGRFKQGVMFDIDAPIVVAVGPNGGGKTALLRLLATSLEFSRYYQRNGISHFWDVVGLDQAPKQAVAKQLGVQEAPKGWFKFDDRLLNGLTGLLCTRSGIHLRRHLKLIQNPLIRHGSELVLTYPNPYSSFWAISSKGRELFFTLEARLREPTDLNIWGFVKPTFSGNGEIFIQHLGIPKEHEDVTQEDIGLRSQMTFNSKYYCEASPGLTQNARLESFFRAIRAFFTKHRNPIWVHKDLSPMGRFHEMINPVAQQFEEVPRGARLCVFMDEPTIYLDPVNRLKFIQQLLKLIERFPGRLQFFIATNDGLHTHLQSRAVYIDLYAQPPVSSTSLELAQYLK